MSILKAEKRRLVVCYVVNSFIAQQLFATPLPFEQNYFDLPSMPLSKSLIEFAFQAKTQIVADKTVLKGFVSARLHGSYSTSAALHHILSGSPFCLSHQTKQNLYIVHRCDDESALVDDAQSQVEPEHLQEILVSYTQFPSRYQSIVNTNARNGVSMFDSSRFHSVISHALIEDLSPTSFFDAIELSSGITYSDRYLNTAEDYYVRGFLRHNTYLNGLRISESSIFRIVPESVDHIAIQKGPSMLYYGQSAAGGVVDVIKTIEDKNKVFIKSEFSDRGDLRQFIEANRVFSPLNNAAVKVTGFFDNFDSTFLSNNESAIVSIGGNMDVSEYMKLYFSYERQNLFVGQANSFPVLSEQNQILSPNYSEWVGMQHPDFSATSDLWVGSISFFPTTAWRFQSAFLVQSEHRYGVRITPGQWLYSDFLLDRNQSENQIDAIVLGGMLVAPVLRETWGLLTSDRWGTAYDLDDQEAVEQNVALNFSMQGHFKLADIDNRLEIGGDVYSQQIDERFSLRPHRLTTDALVPNSGDYAELVSLIDDGALLEPWLSGNYLKEYSEDRRDLGLFFQFNTYWSNVISTFFGARYSRFSGARIRKYYDGPHLAIDADDLSFQVGLVWHVFDNLSLFSNYSENASLHYVLDDTFDFADKPEKSKQWELGLKGIFYNGKLLNSVSLYKIQSDNIFDIHSDLGSRYLRGPFVRRVAGIEFESSYQASPHLDFLMNLSISKHQLDNADGDKLAVKLIADNTAGIAARYSFRKSWSIAASLNFVSDRSVDDSGKLKIGSYNNFDLSISKDFRVANNSQKLTFKIGNVEDNKYNLSAYPGIRVTPGEGRFCKLSWLILI